MAQDTESTERALKHTISMIPYTPELGTVRKSDIKCKEFKIRDLGNKPNRTKVKATNLTVQI